MKQLIILFLLLLMPLCYAQTIFNVEKAILEIDVSSALNIQKTSPYSEITQLQTNMYLVPKKESWQTPESAITLPKDSQKESGEIIFTWTPPKDTKLYFQAKTKVILEGDTNRVRAFQSFPVDYQFLDPNLKQYLKPTLKIDSNNTKIIDLADALTVGETDEWNVVSKLGIWVKQNVQYNLSTLTANVSQSAGWVLDNKQGVCDEITNLFIALLRAKGIPARFVQGIAYTNSPELSNSWGLHGWTEVFFPDFGWVPFDITFGQFGWIDKGHIKFRAGFDSEQTSLKTSWRGKDVAVVNEPLVVSGKFLSLEGQKEPEFTLKSQLYQNNVGFGSYDLLEVEIINNKPYYQTTTLQISDVDEMEFDNSEKYIILEPGESKKEFFMLHIKPDLQKQFVYEIPVVATTDNNESVYLTLKSSAQDVIYSQAESSRARTQSTEEIIKPYSQFMDLSCNTEKDSFYASEDVILTCDLKNKGEKLFLDITVCIFNQCKETKSEPKSTAKIVFNAYTPKSGKQDLFIVARNEELSVKTKKTIEILDEPIIKLQDINYPSDIGAAEDFNLVFNLSKQSYSAPQNVVVQVVLANSIQKVNIDKLSHDIPVNLALNSNDLNSGDNSIEINIFYQDSIGQQYSAKEKIEITKTSNWLNEFWAFIKKFFNNVLESFS